MTGFDETVPPDENADPDTDATAAENADDNVVPPQDGPEGLAAERRAEHDRAPDGAPEFVDADDERPPAPTG